MNDPCEQRVDRWPIDDKGSMDRLDFKLIHCKFNQQDKHIDAMLCIARESEDLSFGPSFLVHGIEDKPQNSCN